MDGLAASDAYRVAQDRCERWLPKPGHGGPAALSPETLPAPSNAYIRRRVGTGESHGAGDIMPPQPKSPAKLQGLSLTVIYRCRNFCTCE
jgi:hypothetical protein